MRSETYKHIEKYIGLLEINYENGVILNRKTQIVLGYSKVKFKQKMVNVHAVIGFLKYGKKINNPKLVINHIDGNKTNNKPENLELVSQSKNMIHAFKHGLKKPSWPKGSQHTNSKLTDDKVKEIKILLKSDMLIKDIANKFGVDRSTISRIKSGERWVHVE